MTKKFLILISALMIFSSSAYAVNLPDNIGEWHSVSENITPLIAGSEDLGRVVYKNYERESPKGFLQIILTEGDGTGGLYVPNKIKDSKGLMPSTSGYKILNVSGKRAILETQSNLPLVIAVNYSENAVITIETNSLNEDEIINFSEEILRQTH